MPTRTPAPADGRSGRISIPRPDPDLPLLPLRERLEQQVQRCDPDGPLVDEGEGWGVGAPQSEEVRT